MKPSHTPSTTLLPSIWEHKYNIAHLLSIYTHDIIYELTEQVSGKKYILKILDKKYFHRKLYKTLSSSGCNFLLLPIDLTEDSHFVYFIYEYYTCLTDLLLVREFSYTELSIFMQDIGNAILFLHDNHITHRDIAPGNIFMRENGHFLLGDFSSSRFEEKSFLPNFNLMTVISCKINNSGCRRTGNTPFFSPLNYTNMQNGYYIDIYSFATLLYLLINEFKPPSEDDYAQLHSFSTSKHADKENSASSISNFEIKELLLTILLEMNPKKPPDFHTLFYQIENIFQSMAVKNPMFHTTIIQPENTDFFLRTASLTKKNSRQKPAAPSPAKPAHSKNKPDFSILLYGLLFLSILLFSISFYRSLISKQQKQTAITQSVVSEQEKTIFMNRQNLTSVDFLQENHSVEILVLSENNISSVKPISGLSQLLILDLSCNQHLTDILSLTSLQHLQQLILTDTNITKEEYAILQDALPGCTILY